MAVMDGRTREQHHLLHHIVRPIGDPFWKTYYPPNGWNCRCSVLQLDEHEAGNRHREPLPGNMPPVDPMFQNNVGINPVVYSPKHPYFATIPPDVLQRVMEQSGALQKLKPERLEVLTLSRSEQFEVANESKARVLVHKLVDRNSSSFKAEVQIAIEKAKQGIEVEMLPTMDSEMERFYFHPKIFPGAKKDKCPDYRLDKKIYAEHEGAVGTGKNNLKDAIERGAKQADYVIVVKNNIVDWKKVYHDAKMKFIDFPRLKIVEVWSGGNKRIYERKKLIKE